MRNGQATDELVQQALVAMQAGNNNLANQLLDQAIQLDPQNEKAWLGLAEVAPNDMRRRYCLKQVLAVNPNNVEAKQQLGLQDEASQQPQVPGINQAPDLREPAVQEFTASQTWKYMFAEFVLTEKGYMLVLLNNRAVREGQTTDLAHYSNSMGQEGWELVNSVMTRRSLPKNNLSIGDLLTFNTNNLHDVLMLIFKRLE